LNLIKEICNKYGVDVELFHDLISIEKKHADRNIPKRIGIFKELSERILETVERDGRNEI
jgi:hypothetical protein